MPPPYAVYAMPRPRPARLAVAIGRVLRTIADALSGSTARRRRTASEFAEREALGELSEHLLKDIGAPSRLVANAATRARDARAWEFDGGFY